MDDLSHLFSAYFYEAWDDFEYQSWQDAVDDFARRSPERVEGASGALQELLADQLTDAELDKKLRDAGCTFVSDTGDRAWLQHLLSRLRRESAPMEAVKYLMGAYFHQDWVMDGGQSSDTVSLFLHERRDIVASTAEQIDELLAKQLPEGSLAALLDEWGSYYYAGETDAEYRTWLIEIRDQIRSSLTTSAAS